MWPRCCEMGRRCGLCSRRRWLGRAVMLSSRLGGGRPCSLAKAALAWASRGLRDGESFSRSCRDALLRELLRLRRALRVLWRRWGELLRTSLLANSWALVAGMGPVAGRFLSATAAGPPSFILVALPPLRPNGHMGMATLGGGLRIGARTRDTPT